MSVKPDFLIDASINPGVVPGTVGGTLIDGKAGDVVIRIETTGGVWDGTNEEALGVTIDIIEVDCVFTNSTLVDSITVLPDNGGIAVSFTQPSQSTNDYLLAFTVTDTATTESVTFAVFAPVLASIANPDTLGISVDIGEWASNKMSWGTVEALINTDTVVLNDEDYTLHVVSGTKAKIAESVINGFILPEIATSARIIFVLEDSNGDFISACCYQQPYLDPYDFMQPTPMPDSLTTMVVGYNATNVVNNLANVTTLLLYPTDGDGQPYSSAAFKDRFIVDVTAADCRNSTITDGDFSYPNVSNRLSIYKPNSTFTGTYTWEPISFIDKETKERYNMSELIVKCYKYNASKTAEGYLMFNKKIPLAGESLIVSSVITSNPRTFPGVSCTWYINGVDASTLPGVRFGPNTYSNRYMIIDECPDILNVCIAYTGAYYASSRNGLSAAVIPLAHKEPVTDLSGLSFNLLEGTPANVFSSAIFDMAPIDALATTVSLPEDSPWQGRYHGKDNATGKMIFFTPNGDIPESVLTLTGRYSGEVTIPAMTLKPKTSFDTTVITVSNEDVYGKEVTYTMQGIPEVSGSDIKYSITWSVRNSTTNETLQLVNTEVNNVTLTMPEGSYLVATLSWSQYTFTDNLRTVGNVVDAFSYTLISTVTPINGVYRNVKLSVTNIDTTIFSLVLDLNDFPDLTSAKIELDYKYSAGSNTLTATCNHLTGVFNISNNSSYANYNNVPYSGTLTINSADGIIYQSDLSVMNPKWPCSGDSLITYPNITLTTPVVYNQDNDYLVDVSITNNLIYDNELIDLLISGSSKITGGQGTLSMNDLADTTSMNQPYSISLPSMISGLISDGIYTSAFPGMVKGSEEIYAYTVVTPNELIQDRLPEVTVLTLSTPYDLSVVSDREVTSIKSISYGKNLDGSNFVETPGDTVAMMFGNTYSPAITVRCDYGDILARSPSGTLGIVTSGIVTDRPTIDAVNGWDKNKIYPGEPLTLMSSMTSASGMKLEYSYAFRSKFEGDLKNWLTKDKFYTTEADGNVPLTIPIANNDALAYGDIVTTCSSYSYDTTFISPTIGIGAQRVSDSPIYKYEAFLDDGVKTVRAYCIRADYTTQHFVTIDTGTVTVAAYLKDLDDPYFISIDVVDDAFYDALVSSDGGLGLSFMVTAEKMGTNILGVTEKTVAGKTYLGFSSGSKILHTYKKAISQETFGYMSNTLIDIDDGLYGTKYELVFLGIFASDPNTLIIEWDYNLLSKVGNDVTFSIGNSADITTTLVADGERVVAKFTSATEVCNALRAVEGVNTPVTLNIDFVDDLVYGDALINTALAVPIEVTLPNEEVGSVFFNTDTDFASVVGFYAESVADFSILTMGVSSEPFIRVASTVPGDIVTLEPSFSTFNATGGSVDDKLATTASFLIDNDGIGWFTDDTTTAVSDNWSLWAGINSNVDIDVNNVITGFNVVHADKVLYPGEFTVTSVVNNSSADGRGYSAGSAGRFGTISDDVINQDKVLYESGDELIPYYPIISSVIGKNGGGAYLEFLRINPYAIGAEVTITDSKGVSKSTVIMDDVTSSFVRVDLPEPAGYDLLGTVPGTPYSFDLSLDSAGIYNDCNLSFQVRLYSNNFMNITQYFSEELHGLLAATVLATFVPYPSPTDSFVGFELKVPAVQVQGWEYTMDGVASEPIIILPGESKFKAKLTAEQHNAIITAGPTYLYGKLEKVFTGDNGIIIGKSVEGDLTYSGFSVDKGIGSLLMPTMKVIGNFEVDADILGLYILTNASTSTTTCIMELSTNAVDALGRTLTVTMNGHTVVGIVVEGIKDDGSLMVSLTGDAGFNDEILNYVNSGLVRAVGYSLSESTITQGLDALIRFKDIPSPTGNVKTALVESINHSILPEDGDSSWFKAIYYNQKANGDDDALYLGTELVTTPGSELRMELVNVVDNDTIPLFKFTAQITTSLNLGDGQMRMAVINPDDLYYQDGKYSSGRSIIDNVLSLLGEDATFNVTRTEPNFDVGDYNVTVGFNTELTQFGYRRGEYGELDVKGVIGEVDKFNKAGTNELTIVGAEFHGESDVVFVFEPTAVTQIGRTLTYHSLDDVTTFDATLTYNETTGFIEANFGPTLAALYTKVYTGFKLGFGLSMSGETSTSFIGNTLARTSSKVAVGKYVARSGTIHLEGDFIIKSDD